MNEKAKDLAQALVNSEKQEYTQTFTVGGDEDDVIVINVTRTNRRIEKSIKRFHEVVLMPSGSVCGCCNGSGRA